MKKNVFRAISVLMTAVLLLSCVSLFGCGEKKKEIVIYTSAEDFRIEYMQARLEEQFPNLKIVLEYKSSGDHAAQLMSEGTNSACQISHDIEYGYAAQLAKAGVFADLKDVLDFSVYAEDAVESTFYAPEYRNGGAIILNMDVINEKGLKEPTSYADLLDPQYKDLIAMPNPKASGTGYMFLLSLVNAMGEDAALAYFDQLSENVLSFSSSGSGPVNALVQKEVAIGLGMTFQAVQEISAGENLKIVFFDQGSPFTLYGQSIVAGNEDDADVIAVFQFLATVLTEEQCEKFVPEKIYKDKTFTIENYPVDIPYANMSNNTPERKVELLDKWNH